MRLRKSLAATLFGLSFAAAPAVHGQSGHCLDRTFIANVFDHGAVPTGLTKDNFQIAYHGQSLTPLHISYSEGPRRVMVLLDVSGSMSTLGNTAKWKIARLAAWDLVAALLPGSKVGLITFSTTSETQAPLSTNHAPITDWINRGENRRLDMLKGRTALYDAIQSALTQLRPTEPGDAIYVITDGGENASKTGRSKVQTALRESGVRLFTLILPPGSTYTAVELTGSENLSSLSNDSGGFVETLGIEPTVRVVDERLKQQLRVHSLQLSLQIAAFYSLSVELPDNPQKPKHWEITIADSGKRKKSVWVGYPHEVPSCQMHLAQR